MSSAARADGGDGDDEDGPDPAELWERVGRGAVKRGVESAWHDLEDEMYDLLYETLEQGEDPDVEQLNDIRHAIYWLERMVEDHVALPAGNEPWEDFSPYAPVGKIRDAINCECHDRGDAEEEADE